MKELDTMTVTKVGQGTLPKWWREASGLSQGVSLKFGQCGMDATASS